MKFVVGKRGSRTRQERIKKEREGVKMCNEEDMGRRDERFQRKREREEEGELCSFVNSNLTLSN